jgi:hypothetical protein
MTAASWHAMGPRAGCAHARAASSIWPPLLGSAKHASPGTDSRERLRVEHRRALSGEALEPTRRCPAAPHVPSRRAASGDRTEGSVAPRMRWRRAAERSACASGDRHGLGRIWRMRFSASPPSRACRPRPWHDAFSVPWRACALGAGSSGSANPRRVGTAPLTTPCFARGGRPARTSRRWPSPGAATMDAGGGRDRPRRLRRRSSLRGDRRCTARAQRHGGRGTGAKARASYVCSALDARGGRAPPWPSGDPLA